MKFQVLMILLGSIVLSLFFSSFNYHDGYFKTTVVISESNISLKMTATYDDEKDEKVVQYLNRCLKPDFSLENDEHIDRKIILKDKTTFNLQFSPGQVRIELLKAENTNSALLRVKKICAGLGDVLNR
jgi:hypothetical protein